MKPKNQTVSLKQAVLRFLENKKPSAYSVNQITRALKLTTPDAERLVSEVVGELVSDRKVTRQKGKKFNVAENTLYMEGTLQVTRSGMGFVKVDDQTEILISEKNLGTAFHEDKVQVLVFPRKPDARMEGQVNAVLERSRIRFVGVLEMGKSFAFVVADDQRIHRDFYIPPRFLNRAKAGDKVIVQMDEWKNPHINPEGRILEVLGRAKDLRVQVISVARGLDLPDQFPPAVEKEAAEISSTLTAADLAGRLDLRNEIVLTIDPDDAKDFDDAISLKELENGNYEIGVHIADVSHYVKMGSKLDKEAAKRGTSIYLVDRVIPMLPEALSNNVCSLVPKQDRLTFSAIIELTPKGIVKGTRFARSVIHSKRRYSYEEVQKILDTGNGDFSDILLKLNKIAKTLTAKRFKSGSIDFDSPEAKFKFNDKGAPIAIIRKDRLDAHRLIEELMLMANRSVAELFASVKKKSQLAALYRVHDKPDVTKLTNLQSLAGSLGFKLEIGDDETSAHSLQKLMNDVKGTDSENVIHQVAIRSMARAVYTPDNIGHYGLSFKDYTHFTSPIRRYPDLIVHRLLNRYAVEHNLTVLYQKTELSALCDACNSTERKAVEAERESVKLMQVEYMKSRIGEEFDGIISGVAQFGLFVEIKDLLVEGLVSVRDLTQDYYVFKENGYALVGEKTGHTYRLGDHIRVECMNANPVKRTIDFKLIEK